MYSQGDGVAQDFVLAVEWFPKAADQGEAWAQHALGVVYVRGKSVPQDNASAYMWLILAAANGYSLAVVLPDADAHDVSPDALSCAQERARICVESQYKICD